MTTKVILYGSLREEFGKEFEFIGLRNVRDAIDALAANFDTFRAAVLKNKRYHIFIDDRDIDEDELSITIPDKTIKIVPTLAVASGGGVKVLLGTALIIGAFFIPGGGALAVGVMKMGIGIALAGFAELIFQPPDPEKLNDEKSYMFTGAVNISQQGVPIPVGYGRLRIGSTNISNSLRNYSSTPYGSD